MLISSCNLGKYYEVTATFDRVDGLYENARVMISGLQIGYVKKIEPVQNKFNVTICIEKKNKISDQAIFVMQNADRLGTKQIVVEHAEGSANYLKGGEITKGVYVAEPVDTTSGIDSLVQKIVKPILDSLGYDVVPKKKR